MLDSLRQAREKAKQEIRRAAHRFGATLQDQLTWARLLLGDRRLAFRRTFDPSTPHGRTVLGYLAKFCGAHESTFHPDPRVQAWREGKREVWLIIQQYTNLTQDQIWELYGRKDLE